jgi:hypothetical protein
MDNHTKKTPSIKRMRTSPKIITMETGSLLKAVPSPDQVILLRMPPWNKEANQGKTPSSRSLPNLFKESSYLPKPPNMAANRPKNQRYLLFQVIDKDFLKILLYKDIVLKLILIKKIILIIT